MAIIGGSAIIICATGGCSAIGNAVNNWWDGDDDGDYDIPDSNYGGYTQTDEDDALDLANSLTGKESCELLKEAITVLENRIRGRKIDADRYGGGDAGHRTRISILEEAKRKLELALSNCC